MKLVLLPSAVAIAFAFTTPAFANDDFDRTIDRIGIQFNSAFVVFKEGLSAPCGAVNTGSLSDSQGKAMYATLLTAKASGGKVFHIGYAVNADGSCSATSLELAN